VRHLVLDPLPHRVRVRERCPGVAIQVHYGDQLPTHPPGPDIVHPQHPVDPLSRLCQLIDDVRVDGVHHPKEELTKRAAQDEENRSRDHKAGDGVGQVEPQPGQTDAHEGPGRHQCIDPRVNAVRRERCGADRASNSSLVLRHAQVGDHANGCREQA